MGEQNRERKIEKLSICCPTAIGLWIAALIMIAVAWRAAIK
jgi:hypothetical protein